METTDFADILSEAAVEVTALDPDNLDAAEFAAIRRSARRRLEMAWEYHYWPDLGRVEQRFYRESWDAGTDYAAGTEVYYSPTQQYYQALQDNTGELPADAYGETNLEYWAESKREYEADTYSATATYVQGDSVEYGDQVYQLFAATATGVTPTDTSHWGELTPFDQYIGFTQTGKTAIGIVTAAWSSNPRTSTRGNELNWFLSDNGVQISTPINYAWVEYRVRAPKLTGSAYSASALYQAGDQIYYSASGVAGNFYDCVVSTLAGQTPVSTPASWSLVELPRIFHKYLVHGVSADWIRGPGGGSMEDATAQLALAQQALEDAKTLVVGQQSQRVKTIVRTR